MGSGKGGIFVSSGDHGDCALKVWGFRDVGAQA